MKSRRPVNSDVMRLFTSQVVRNSIAALMSSFLLLCLPGVAHAAQNESGFRVSALPQAQPVYNLLRAVEISDFNLYRSVWASETQKMYRERKSNWPKIRRVFRKMFREDLGHYRLAGLRFDFRKESESNAGVVFIMYKGHQRTGFNVIEEKGKWKIREM